MKTHKTESTQQPPHKDELDDLLRRMLSTPPKPHPKPEKAKPKKKTTE